MVDLVKCPFCNGTGAIHIDGGLSRPCEHCEGNGDMLAKEFTCYECLDNGICQFAFDCYNTNGDCIAAK